MIPVIMDVDTGIDDAVALMLATASEEISLLGVTTVSGNVSVDHATRNTKRILKGLGYGQIPVHRGSAKPLVRPLVDATQIHGHNGLNNQLTGMDVMVPLEETAIDFLAETFRNQPGSVTLITTGPLTNIARLFEKAPDVVGKIGRMIMMGGVVAGRGNHTPVAEFNILTDPEAAYRVFHAGVADLTLVSLDVTRKALLREAHLDWLTDPGSREMVRALTEAYMSRFEAATGERACPMHDPLTVLYLLDSDILQTQREFVTVETRSRFCDGMTLCDFGHHYGEPPNLTVTRGIDVPAFEKDMEKLLSRVRWKENG